MFSDYFYFHPPLSILRAEVSVLFLIYNMGEKAFKGAKFLGIVEASNPQIFAEKYSGYKRLKIKATQSTLESIRTGGEISSKTVAQEGILSRPLKICQRLNPIS